MKPYIIIKYLTIFLSLSLLSLAHKSSASTTLDSKVDTLTTPNPGDTVHYGGWIFTLDSNSNVTFYSPFGDMKLDLSGQTYLFDPFTGQWTFANTGGVLAILKSQPNYIESLQLNTDTLTIGSEICKEKEETEIVDSTGLSAGDGLDAYGFDSTGVHHLTDTTFDPNGYQQDGIHHITGTAYNPCGCNRDSLTAQGEECNPYDCNSSSTYQAMADSLRNSILDSVLLVMNQLLSQVSDTLNAIDCETIRTELSSLATNTGVNRELFFGENDKFLQVGMSTLFDKKPKVLPQISGRQGLYKEIENKHIKLYTCDERYTTYANLDTLISDLLQDSSQLNDLKEYILTAITYWNEYQFYSFTNDHNKFRNWIILKTGEFLNVDPSSLTSADVIMPPTNIYRIPHRPRTHSFSQYGMHIIPHVSTVFSRLIDSLERHESTNSTVRHDQFNRTATYRNNAAVIPQSSDEMPVIIEKEIGNKTYKIILDNIHIYLDSLVFDAYCVIHDSQSDRDLLFSAMGVSIDNSGQLSNAKLLLGNRIEINLFNSVKLSLLPTQHTYVEWDTSGFKSLGIDALVEVCRNVLVPLDDDFNVKPEPELVSFQLTMTNISEWLEFSTVLSVQEPFAVAGHEKDVAFELDSLILDFSSTHTPSFTPIQGYTNPFYNSGTMPAIWKGVYIANISCTLLRKMSQSNQPLQLAGEKLLFDRTGFSGRIAAENVLTIADGSMSGWPVSIDDMYLKFLKNDLTGGGIGGLIGLPVSDHRFDYSAEIDSRMNFDLMISPTDTLNIDMWFAEARIKENSKIIVKYVGDSLLLKAHLHGDLDIIDNVGVGSVNLTFPDLSFNNLIFSTQAPYLKIGTWGIKDSTAFEASIGGFSLIIDEITSIDTLGLQGLNFNIEVNMSSSVNITAGGNFALLGKRHVNNQTGLHRWEYDRLALNKLHIDCSFQGMTRLHGSVEWFGHLTTPDSVYGRGVRGSVHATFSGIDVEVTAVAQFGKLDSFKYFYVDAYAHLANLAVRVGAFKLTGFGGGMAYHMTMDQSAMMSLGVLDPPTGLDGPGSTISGAVLIPSISTGIALNANIGFALADENIFNGMGSFRIEFGAQNFSVQKIAITGVGQFLRNVDFDVDTDDSDQTQPPPMGAPIAAYANIVFDFRNSSLHGVLKAFVNTPFITGAGLNGKVVDAEFHIDPDKWYIYIGRPEEGQRCGLIVNIASLNIAATAYFDVGTSVPSMPPLPSTVREIAYKVNTNESLRQSGAGMVFGASLVINISVKAASIVEASVEAGAGFDVMLKDYENLSCHGSSDPVGINGWYASGQLWAYLQGKLRVFGVPVFEAGLAAVLQARMPNPFWSQATVGVYVRIAGIRVRKSLKLELGDDCLLVTQDGSDPGIGMDVISFITPMDGLYKAELFTDLEVDFTLPINKRIKINSITGSGEENTYHAEIEYISIRNADSISIGFQTLFNEDSTNVQLLPYSFLPHADTITIQVKVDVYKNGEWTYEEIKSSTFTTANKRVDIIPVNNVDYAYPAPGMVNFYRANIPELKGYIQLIKGQGNLLEATDELKQIVRITRESDGAELIEELEYDRLEALISFPLDTTFLTKRCSFNLQLVEVKNGRFDEVYATNNSAIGGLSSNSYSTIPSNNLVHDSDTVAELERVLYEVDFRVSTYDRFQDKFDAINAQERFTYTSFNGNQSQSRAQNLNAKYIRLEGEEMLDKMELYGTAIHAPFLYVASVIESGTMEKIESIVDDLSDINDGLYQVCSGEISSLQRAIDENTNSVVINVNKSREFSHQEINVYETIAQNPFDNATIEEEYQDMQGNLLELQKSMLLYGERAYGCFARTCLQMPDDVVCQHIFPAQNTNNATPTQPIIEEIKNIPLGEVNAILTYLIGDRKVAFGTIEF